MMWTILKSWAYPILKWLVTQAYANNFNIKVLKEKYILNKDANRKLLLKHTVSITKIALKKFDAMQSEIESNTEGFVGSINDEELLGGSSLYTGQELPNITRSLKVYDQREFNISYVLCFGYGNLNNLSMNTGITFNDKVRKELAINFTKTRGYGKKGGYMSLGAEEVEKMAIREGHDIKLYSLSTKSKYLIPLLKQGYRIAMPISISSEMKRGLYNDGILQASEMVGATRYGHLLNIGYDANGVCLWIDNYPNNKKWIYTIEELKALVDSGKFMNTARFFVNNKTEKKTIKVSDADKFYKRGFINKKTPNRNMNEKLYATLQERFISELETKLGVSIKK